MNLLHTTFSNLPWGFGNIRHDNVVLPILVPVTQQNHLLISTHNAPARQYFVAYNNFIARKATCSKETNCRSWLEQVGDDMQQNVKYLYKHSSA